MKKLFCLLLFGIFFFGNDIIGGADVHYFSEDYSVADSPSKYGFKGLYTLFSPVTYQQGHFGVSVYWDMARFCLPGDPRYPQLQEFTLASAYGLTDRIELGASFPFRYLHLPAASSSGRQPDDVALHDITENGISNISLGLRYNLIYSEYISLTPYIQLFLPTAQKPQQGHGADNIRVHIGVSGGTAFWYASSIRVYGQIAYQWATDYEQLHENFSERTPEIGNSRPRFERFGTNPLFHEYGNTLFYGAGLSLSNMEESAEMFAEFQLYHSFEKQNYIPLFEDYTTLGQYEPLDVVQDGGMAYIAAKLGLGNGLTLTAGWGGILFAEEPMYESPTWKAFAGMTYNSPHIIQVSVGPPDLRFEKTPPSLLHTPDEPLRVVPASTNFYWDCPDLYKEIVFFEFDKSTLTPEAIVMLQRIGQYLRICKYTSLEVQGHTDWEGTENYNIALANRRARAVIYYLIYDEGIEPERVVLSKKLEQGLLAGESYGETVPLAPNDNKSGRAMNRRVQFVRILPD